MTKKLTGSTALFEASRRRLLSIAYRMLGSFSEAEDVVQEAWIRWYTTDNGQLKTPVAWLTTVVTRLSIDRLRRLQRERTAEASHWLPEPWLDEHAPSAEDAVSMLSDLSYGVLLLLERLTPDERAALLLFEVFDCQYEEIARTLNKTPAHCRQLVRRAKEHVQSDRVRNIMHDAQCTQLADDFLNAICRQDKSAMLRLVAPDALVIGDSGGSTPVASLAVTQPASSFINAIASLDASDLQVERVCMNGGWGAAVLWRGEIAFVLSVEMGVQGISTIYAVATQHKLRGIEYFLAAHCALCA